MKASACPVFAGGGDCMGDIVAHLTRMSAADHAPVAVKDAFERDEGTAKPRPPVGGETNSRRLVP
ncbi:MAG: hypothetical protein QOI84_176 [Solirubrobacterales bacterium]|jgi:hypothetical protein|nr:hypothetical protein [Solirubrobacterales bacterium]